ncbi:MAG: hypothetical protein Q8O67_20315 [Deltaproteobacteria bacterium]|nr:hypothetical protein [Deltaproteobacteria bacterium]
MPLPPWIIAELEDEHHRREEQERVRSSRIELPQASVSDEEHQPTHRPSSLHILDISPVDTNVIDI